MKSMFFKLESATFEGEGQGVAVSEARDADAEKLDYWRSKPLFQEWARQVSRNTNGKSLGPLLVGHDATKPAGIITGMDFDDVNRKVYINFRVVDENSKAMLEAGCFQGLSVGGRYAERKPDGTYTAQPVEISLVHAPSNPEAVFEYLKANGTRELRKFAPRNTVAELRRAALGAPQFKATLARVLANAAARRASRGRRPNRNADAAKVFFAR